MTPVGTFIVLTWVIISYKKPMRLTLIILLVIITSCTKGEKPNSVELELVKVDEVILKPSQQDMFGNFRERFKISKDGKMFVFADRIKEKVYLFDNRGNFINRIGEPGKGPKGILSVNGFAVDNNNNIIILDMRQRLLKVFDVEGQLLSSTTIFEDEDIASSSPLEFHVNGGAIYIPIIEMKYFENPAKSRLIGKFNYNGQLDTLYGQFDPFINEDKNYKFSNRLLITEEEVIYSNLQTSPFIFEYNLTKNELYQFGIRSPSFRLPNKEIAPGLPIPEISKRAVGTSYVIGLYEVGSSLIQHYQSMTEEWFETVDYSEKKNFLVVYDREDREYKGELSTPHTLASVSENKLYFIEDFNPDNYTLGIYELVENEL